MMMDSAPRFEPLFRLRHVIARIGEADWLRWWDSHALTAAGQYAMQRLFRRTPALSAAHVSFAAARARHGALLPEEPLVHLFHFGELVEGAFERWLVARKANGWTPEPLPTSPTEAQRGSVTESLRDLGVDPAELAGTKHASNAMALGSVSASELTGGGRLSRLAATLAGAYSASEPGGLVVPYLRLKG